MPHRSTPIESLLTTSGLLYEENFNEWQQRVSAAFVLKGRPELAYPSIARIPSPSGRVVYHYDEFLDNECVTDKVSPALLDRVRYRCGLSVGELYAELEKLCTPFRLMDVSEEVRARMFKQVIKEWKRSGFRSKNETWAVEPPNWVPALLSVSSQLRQEVLHLYFANAAFCLNADEAERHVWRAKGYHNAVRSVLDRWANAFVGTSAVHLRRFIL